MRKQLNIPGLAFVSAGRWLKYAQAQIDFRRSVVANKRNGAMVRILEQSNNLSLCCTTVSLVFYSVCVSVYGIPHLHTLPSPVWQLNPTHLHRQLETAIKFHVPSLDEICCLVRSLSVFSFALKEAVQERKTMAPRSLRKRLPRTARFQPSYTITACHTV